MQIFEHDARSIENHYKLFGKQKGKKYHTRLIEVNTFEYDQEHLAVEGCLTDHRYQEYILTSGKKGNPGLLHSMKIMLLVNKTTLEIEDLEVKMPVVPDEECLESMMSLKSIRGLKIARGFSLEVKKLAGNASGCKHFSELLVSMGSSIMQGYFAFRQLHSPLSVANLIAILKNACWTWRSEGRLVKGLEDSIRNRTKKDHP